MAWVIDHSWWVTESASFDGFGCDLPLSGQGMEERSPLELLLPSLEHPSYLSCETLPGYGGFRVGGGRLRSQELDPKGPSAGS